MDGGVVTLPLLVVDDTEARSRSGRLGYLWPVSHSLPKYDVAFV